jgi:uncharacterized protein
MLRMWTTLLVRIVMLGTCGAALADDARQPAGFGIISDSPAIKGFRWDDFELREAMVPMRDGTRLYTVIARPRGDTRALPILLEHTPYDATTPFTGSEWYGGRRTPSLASTLGAWSASLVRDGYIFVFQDVRGKAGSEGEYSMFRHARGAGATASDVDTSTDIYDSIEWLTKNLPNNNGRVAVWGTSYPGRTALMALIEPHAALKAVVPFNPVVDLWIGDDMYHQGAFRLGFATEFAFAQSLASWTSFPFAGRDAYQWHLDAGPAAEFGARWFERKLPFWEDMVAHPSYDKYWRANTLIEPLKRVRLRDTAVLHVHSWFDQEDSFGAPAAYAALEANDSAGQNFFVAGPWFHSQWVFDGAHLNAIRWNSDTGREFRERVLVPFLRRYLHGVTGAASGLREAEVFETGSNAWRGYDAWPPRNATERRLYLRAGGKLSFDAPRSQEARLTSYVSDPLKPVPFRNDVFATVSGGEGWQHWLGEDQRPFARRPDVVTFVSEPLDAPLHVVGQPTAQLRASTTGADADWVVKLIDVYPTDYAEQDDLSGYQFMIAGDIMRGRYRSDFAAPRPVKPGAVEAYPVALPSVNHVFRKGHRVAVQIQSSWFPLYDRNPQTYVENIHRAGPRDFRAATHSVYHSSEHMSHVTISVLAGVKD